MPGSRQHQVLPAAGPEREALREKGQFWTPDWVAQGMVQYVLQGAATHLFDPAVGEGAFLRAALAYGRATGKAIELQGTEIDSQALRQARASGLSDNHLLHVEVRDFVLNPPQELFPAIVANPPYIRHHRLDAALKAFLKQLSTRLIGKPLDGRAGLHVYFLLRALERLAPGGRLAFIMPADTVEGIFAPTLWQWIAQHYDLEAVVSFEAEASPFPGVDTNPLIFMIRRSTPTDHFVWARCLHSWADLKGWVASGFEATAGITEATRSIHEGLATGLSRPPQMADDGGPTLGDYARVLRGIATGANEFFFLTLEQIRERGLPDEMFRLAIGRTRDVSTDEITASTLGDLEIQGRPTRLFAPDGRPLDLYNDAVQSYLRHGESLGLAERPLIASRRPWYKMEVRQPPPFLFAYLGRRNTRFIRNRIDVVPLTGFLCVYPHHSDAENIDRLWDVLRHPDTISSLGRVGKSYGGGAIKVEPRALERLPLSVEVLQSVGLNGRHAQVQIPLF